MIISEKNRLDWIGHFGTVWTSSFRKMSIFVLVSNLDNFGVIWTAVINTFMWKKNLEVTAIFLKTVQAWRNALPFSSSGENTIFHHRDKNPRSSTWPNFSLKTAKPQNSFQNQRTRARDPINVLLRYRGRNPASARAMNSIQFGTVWCVLQRRLVSEK